VSGWYAAQMLETRETEGEIDGFGGEEGIVEASWNHSYIRCVSEGVGPFCYCCGEGVEVVVWAVIEEELGFLARYVINDCLHGLDSSRKMVSGERCRYRESITHELLPCAAPYSTMISGFSVEVGRLLSSCADFSSIGRTFSIASRCSCCWELYTPLPSMGTSLVPVIMFTESEV